MEQDSQDELRKNVKLWLKANGHDYAWLAKQCYVTESTVRNWMARKPIPAAKVYIIHDIVRQVPLVMPSVQVNLRNVTCVTLNLDDATRIALERLAFTQGKTLNEMLESEIARLAISGAEHD